MISYGLAYGMEAYGLSQRLGVPVEEAAAILGQYFAAFPNVKEYMSRTVGEARPRGYTETLFGRRRYLPELDSANYRVRQAAERQAMNAGIQGLAADIFKVALVRLDGAARGARPAQPGRAPGSRRDPRRERPRRSRRGRRARPARRCRRACELGGTARGACRSGRELGRSQGDAGPTGPGPRTTTSWIELAMDARRERRRLRPYGCELGGIRSQYRNVGRREPARSTARPSLHTTFNAVGRHAGLRRPP